MSEEVAVEIGDVLDTPYGRMEVVDIETRYDGSGYIECRMCASLEEMDDE